MLLPIYLLVLAAFLLFLNLKAASTPGKFLSYVGMWSAVIGSAATALVVYT